jgi:hypothetical protein
MLVLMFIANGGRSLVLMPFAFIAKPKSNHSEPLSSLRTLDSRKAVLRLFLSFSLTTTASDGILVDVLVDSVVVWGVKASVRVWLESMTALPQESSPPDRFVAIVNAIFSRLMLQLAFVSGSTIMDQHEAVLLTYELPDVCAFGTQLVAACCSKFSEICKSIDMNARTDESDDDISQVSKEHTEMLLLLWHVIHSGSTAFLTIQSALKSPVNANLNALVPHASSTHVSIKHVSPPERGNEVVLTDGSPVSLRIVPSESLQHATYDNENTLQQTHTGKHRPLIEMMECDAHSVSSPHALSEPTNNMDHTAVDSVAVTTGSQGDETERTTNSQALATTTTTSAISSTTSATTATSAATTSTSTTSTATASATMTTRSDLTQAVQAFLHENNIAVTCVCLCVNSTYGESVCNTHTRTQAQQLASSLSLYFPLWKVANFNAVSDIH